MLSCDGKVIGVFAIFDTEPRATFSPEHRRELAIIASVAVKGLGSELDVSDIRSTPILERFSLINGEYHPVAAPLSNAPEIEKNLFKEHQPLRREKKPQLISFAPQQSYN